VKNGRYRLRRPVLMRTATQPDPLTDSFLSFVRSVDGQPLLRTMFVPIEPSVPATVPSYKFLGAALSVSDALTFLERRGHVSLNFLCGQCTVVEAHFVE